jgi:phenylacetate-coenzyme A ligase PaaK-like adenylate-forming protein
VNKLRVVPHFISMRFFLRHMSRKALEKRQQRMLRRHLRYVRRHSAFYGQIMDDNTVLTDLPIMDKTSMMENFNTLNTVGVDRRGGCVGG